MSPSSFEKAIRLQFDCLIRKVIDRTVKNYYRKSEDVQSMKFRSVMWQKQI